MDDSEVQPLQPKPGPSICSQTPPLDVERSSSAAETSSSALTPGKLGVYGALYGSHALSTWGQVCVQAWLRYILCGKHAGGSLSACKLNGVALAEVLGVLGRPDSP